MSDGQRVDLAEMARTARARMPALVQEIEDIARRVDPVELLAHLALLFQSHPQDQQPNRDEHAQWQARIEWLSWLVFSHRVTSPPLPEVIDSRILTPLEALLDDYFAAAAMMVAEPVAGLSKEQNELRMDLQQEALYVRGEGFRNQLEGLAADVYSPHEQWCLETLGLTVHDAFAVAKTISTRFTNKLQSIRAASHALQQRILEDRTAALEIADDIALPTGDASQAECEQFASNVSAFWFYRQAKQIVGFTQDELQVEVAGAIAPERVRAFLGLISTTPEQMNGEPSPFDLTPLAQRPFVHVDGRFYLLAPGAMFQAIFYVFHFQLLGDEAYRPTYNDARSAWLEQSAINAFRKILPTALSGWNLDYGPKKARTEVDGLILYDNKLVLVECKWKNLTLSALQGNPDAALKDVEKAILDPLAQAKRARDYIRREGTVIFRERTTGREILVRSSDVAEVFLVTMVGTGAWGRIAANLARLTPFGFFSDGEYPWALSIIDLAVISDFFELPSQLFDYLRRRYRVQQDVRFHVHDEWDFLAVYLAGVLDVDEPRFAGFDLVGLDGFDDYLQDYLYSSFHPDVAPQKRPRREIPAGVLALLIETERVQHVGKTDAICAVLGWPDDGLAEIGKMLETVRRKVILDGRVHAVAATHPWKSTGITIAAGYKTPRAIQDGLWTATQTARERANASEWVGFGMDIAAPGDSIVLYHHEPVDEEPNQPS